jgi:hypothetical protein
MSTIIPNLYAINGVISTDKTVMQNLNDLCSASSSWLTYDISDGKWSVIINRAGLPTETTFDDSNIIGAINVNDTGINELYNAVAVQYPNKDIRDDTDYIDIKLDDSVKFPNEVENTLNIQFDCINNQAQAQILGSIELKQSRLNKVIEFQTDFSKIGLKAGDVIAVTSSVYGFTNKKFRIMSISESDSEVISLSIVAQEYDESIFSTSGLIITPRQKATGIIIKSQNTQIQASNDADVGASFQRLLLANAALGLFNRLFKKVTDPNNPRDPSKFEPNDKDADKILSSVKKPDICELSISPSSVCEGGILTVTVKVCCDSCLFDIPALDYPYEITGVTANDIGVPLTGNLSIVPGQTVTLSIPTNQDEVAEGAETLTFKVGNLTATAVIRDKLGFTYVTNSSPTTITEGEDSTVTLTTTNIPDGTVVPYTITGSATSRVFTDLTGNVTVNNNSATLLVETIDDGIFQGDGSVTVTFNPSLPDFCGELDKTAAITIKDNDPAPPVPPPDTNCNPITVPIFWCPQYDGATGEVVGLAVSKTASFSSPVPGGPTATVPLTVSVTRGNPSTITVLTTAVVDASTNKAGQVYQVQTTFNSMSPNAGVSGSVVTLLGF